MSELAVPCAATSKASQCHQMSQLSPQSSVPAPVPVQRLESCSTQHSWSGADERCDSAAFGGGGGLEFAITFLINYIQRLLIMNSLVDIKLFYFQEAKLGWTQRTKGLCFPLMKQPPCLNTISISPPLCPPNQERICIIPLKVLIEGRTNGVPGDLKKPH